MAIFYTIRFKLFWATLLSYLLLQGLPLPAKISFAKLRQWQGIGLPAEAKTSGGRSRGGSFHSSPSRSSSSSRPRSNWGNSRSSVKDNDFSLRRSRRYHRDRVGSSVTPAARPINTRFVTYLVIIGVLIGGGIIIFFVVYGGLSTLGSKSGKGSLSQIEKERDNDIVTLSKLQIALLAYADEVQTELTTLTTQTDLSSNKGLWKLLHETLNLLLSHAEYWTYAESSSESMSIKQAETRFEEISQTERHKIEETLANIHGQTSYRANANLSEKGATYIVVTLILGTADDNPLFEKIRTVDQLRNALKKLATKRADYLKTVELIWSPQSPENSLTYDDFVLEYPAMIKLAKIAQRAKNV